MACVYLKKNKSKERHNNGEYQFYFGGLSFVNLWNINVVLVYISMDYGAMFLCTDVVFNYLL